MKVKELRKILKNYPDDMIIVMSSDPEGNSFSPLFDTSVNMYLAEGVWYGSIYVMNGDIGTLGYTEEDRAPEEAVPALVLWP